MDFLNGKGDLLTKLFKVNLKTPTNYQNTYVGKQNKAHVYSKNAKIYYANTCAMPCIPDPVEMYGAEKRVAEIK